MLADIAAQEQARKGAVAAAPPPPAAAPGAAAPAPAYAAPPLIAGIYGPPPSAFAPTGPTPEEEAEAAASRVNKVEADAAARDREAHAPFATEAAAVDLLVAIADREAQLLQANQVKAQLAAELERMGSAAPRTLRDRQRKEDLLAQLATTERRLSELRIWLKANVKDG